MTRPLEGIGVPEVLMVLSTLAETGPVNQVYSLLSKVDSDISPAILTLSPEPRSSRADDFEALGVPVSTLGLGRLESFLLGFHRVRRAVKNRDPDVVHTHGLRADLLASLAISNLPTVTTLHTDPREDYPKLYGRLRGEVAAECHLRAVRSHDVQVACSQSVASRVSSIVQTPRVIQNGIDAEKYKPANAKRPLRRDLGLPEEDSIFVSVGAFIKRKQPIKLLHGFLGSGVHGHLVMLGDGPLRERCLALSDESTTFPGYVDEVLPYLQAGDYFVSTSDAEGLPLATVEALGCGLPVALSDIDAHNEILSFNEQAGVIVRGDDVTSVAEGFRELTNRAYQRSSTAARGIVVDHLNSTRMAAEYSELYHEIADKQM